MKKPIYDMLSRRNSIVLSFRKLLNAYKKQSIIDMWGMEWVFSDAWSMIVRGEE